MEFNMVRALRDPEYRRTLGPHQRATLDLVELEDGAIRNISGGCHPRTIDASCMGDPRYDCP